MLFIVMGKQEEKEGVVVDSQVWTFAYGYDLANNLNSNKK